MSQEHPYRNFKIPAAAQFELKPSPGKGWGVYATCKIPCDTLILSEKPLFVIHKQGEYITESEVQKAFRDLAPSAKKQFLSLRDNGSKPFFTMTDALAENAFRETFDGALPATKLLILMSRFNHSCVPNSVIPSMSLAETKDSRTQIFATRDIERGEEILFCYDLSMIGRNVQERHVLLRFACGCPACRPGTTFYELSIVRRRFIRGLLYLLGGKDLDGLKESSATSIILDPRLKQAAENLDIPMSARLIYYLMVGTFLEEEGLMDKVRNNMMTSYTLQIISCFGTVNNACIARLALEQDTWLGRLCVAFRLFGRDDASDFDSTRMLSGGTQ